MRPFAFAIVLAAACSGKPAAPASAPQAAGSQAAGPAAAGSQTATPQPADPPWPVPPGWRSEVIKFPLDFAPSIAHRGFEDLRFPPGFFEPTSGDYWSYAFIWRTEDAAELDAAALGAEVTEYFRGLIAAVDVNRRIVAREQIVVRATAGGPGRFELTAHVFDAFKTAAPVDLTGFAERRSCRTGALWVFVLAPATTKIRPQLDELAGAARCAS